MKNKKTVSLLLTGAMTAALLAAPAQAADSPPAVPVSSYKGNTLEVGERSGLMIAPGGTEYTCLLYTSRPIPLGERQCHHDPDPRRQPHRHRSG